MNSLCLTCLSSSSTTDGSSIEGTLAKFLCDVLHFKQVFLRASTKFICRKCFKILIEFKCFYTQLRDVEIYFENKFSSYANDQVQDPIMVIVDEKSNQIGGSYRSQNEVSTKRFVCKTCNMQFSSVDDLQLHEETHSLVQNKHLNCEDCGEEVFKTKLPESYPKEQSFAMRKTKSYLPVEITPDQKYHKDVWTHEQILSVLSSYAYRREELKGTPMKADKLWEIVAKDIAREGFRKTPQQVKFKYVALKRIYTKMEKDEDYRPKRFRYKKEFDELLADERIEKPETDENNSQRSISTEQDTTLYDEFNT